MGGGFQILRFKPEPKLLKLMLLLLMLLHLLLLHLLLLLLLLFLLWFFFSRSYEERRSRNLLG